jgi:hypothetical protein
MKGSLIRIVSDTFPLIILKKSCAVFILEEMFDLVTTFCSG